MIAFVLFAIQTAFYIDKSSIIYLIITQKMSASICMTKTRITLRLSVQSVSLPLDEQQTSQRYLYQNSITKSKNL